MDYDQYLKKMREIQAHILEYLETEPNSQNDYPNLIKFFDEQNVREDPHIIKEMMRLISKISNNHHRTECFNDKIDHILLSFKNELQQNFNNFEIYSIFHKNNRIAFFLFKEKIITPDISIFCFITNKSYPQVYYPHFFTPEFNPLFQKREKLIQHLNRPKNGLPPVHDHNSKNYENKRKIGENDSNVCHYIRKNNAEEFASYVKKVNLSYEMETHSSIFETNSFLLPRHPTLIEYAAFMGSVNIFKFLIECGIELKPSIWLYAIHSQNMEIINILEEKKIPPEDGVFQDCLLESIKCHHNDITEYFLNTILKNKNVNKDAILSQSYTFNNYKYFPDEMNADFNTFFDMCKYDYYILAKMFLDANINVNSTNIFFVISK